MIQLLSLERIATPFRKPHQNAETNEEAIPRVGAALRYRAWRCPMVQCTAATFADCHTL